MGGAMRDGAARGGASGKAEAILAGAMAVFLERGYADASMDRVASAAGVSKATVYAHFRDKEGLFAALIRLLAREKLGAIVGTADGSQLAGDPRDVLGQLVGTMLETVAGDAQLLAFMRLLIGESGRFPALAQAFVREFDGPLIADLGRYLASRPELGPTNPEAAARVVIGTVFYFAITQELLHGKEILPLPREHLVDTIVSLLVPGAP